MVVAKGGVLRVKPGWNIMSVMNCCGLKLLTFLHNLSNIWQKKSVFLQYNDFLTLIPLAVA